jgi:hypothetical protein
MNWTQIAFDSHYLAAEESLHALEAGDVAEAKLGLRELVEAMGRAERRAVRSQLRRIMVHVLKWHTQPAARSTSWIKSINNARLEIEDSQEEVPSITRDVIESMWDACLEQAIKQAEEEMNQPPALTSLTWEQVFVDSYRV